MHLSAERSGIRLRRDDADRAAHRFRAVESALRAAQHLDARHIDNVRIERLEHRRIVDVEAGGIRTLDPAQRDAAGRERAIGGADGERQIRNGVPIIEKLLHPFRLQLLRRQCGDAETDVLQGFGTLGRGDDDLLKRIAP